MSATHARLYKRNRRGFFSKATVQRYAVVDALTQHLLYWKKRQDAAKMIPLAGTTMTVGAQTGGYYYIEIWHLGRCVRQVATRTAADQLYWMQALVAGALGSAGSAVGGGK